MLRALAIIHSRVQEYCWETTPSASAWPLQEMVKDADAVVQRICRDYLVDDQLRVAINRIAANTDAVSVDVYFDAHGSFLACDFENTPPSSVFQGTYSAFSVLKGGARADSHPQVCRLVDRMWSGQAAAARTATQPPPGSFAVYAQAKLEILYDYFTTTQVHVAWEDRIILGDIFR